MIAKNIKAQSFAGCVRYVMKKDAEVLKAEGVIAMSKEDMITSFEFQRSVRPEIKSPAGHITISFAPEDKERMTNEFMTQLAEEYMRIWALKIPNTSSCATTMGIMNTYISSTALITEANLSPIRTIISEILRPARD